MYMTRKQIVTNGKPNHSAACRNIRVAFHELGRRVNTALPTQIGDAGRLNQQRDECLRLSAMIEQASLLSNSIFYVDQE